jgi:outer membrane biosynthesis protein TonB
MSKASTLRTIETYIDEGAGDRALTSLTLEIGRDRRFTSLLVFSIVFHALLIVFVLRLDWVLFHRAFSYGPRASSLVKLTEVAAPPERLALRTKPEALERADPSRLRFDPSDADDQRLLSRSPTPSEKRGNAGRLPSAEQVERQLLTMTRARRTTSSTEPSGTARPAPTPPSLAEVHPNASAERIEAPVVGVPDARLDPNAPPPAPAPATQGTQRDAARGSVRGSGSESNVLGLSNAQGNFVAYVRAKIMRVNEENMPRKFIEDLLRDKVSAEFGLTIRRDGRVLVLQLVRSSGYAVLDARAREAILLASPFEGYPPTAGDLPPFTVTVYYTPYR